MVWALALGLAGGLNGMSPDGPHVKAGETKPYTPHERVSRPEFYGVWPTGHRDSKSSNEAPLALLVSEHVLTG